VEKLRRQHLPPELATVVLGHLLNAGLTIALAAAMASISDHPSTAAILTLTVTVGTWIVNFVAAIHGGVWERAAAYTPTAMVAEFQHGLIRLDVVLIASALVLTGLTMAAIWVRLGVAVRRRVFDSAGLLGGGRGRDDRVHVRDRQLGHIREPGQLVPEADEAALEQVRGSLHIRRTWRPRIRGARTSSTARCRSFGASCRSCRCSTSRRRRSDSSSRTASTTEKSGTSSTAARWCRA
jgi:hypothetical protein